VNFGPLAAEICWRVWGTPVNFNGFRVLAALLHVTLVVGVSQTLRRWTEGDTYIRQGGHHVGHWPTSLVCQYFVANTHSTVSHIYLSLQLPNTLVVQLEQSMLSLQCVSVCLYPDNKF